jgi:hypothetical protein
VAPNLVENPQAPAPLREDHVCPTAVIVTEAIGENWFRHTEYEFDPVLGVGVDTTEPTEVDNESIIEAQSLFSRGSRNYT